MKIGTTYFLGEQGELHCKSGLRIMDASECRNACNVLEITLGRPFRNSNPCYKAKNGKCRQDGRQTSAVLFVCKSSGDLIENDEYIYTL